MKKIILPIIIIASGFGYQAKSQVGINTTTPASTLDVIAKNATGTTTTPDGLLIPRVDRERAQSMTGVSTSTLIYVNSIATGTATGTAANIDAIGYYFYNGTAWVKLGSDTNTNIYTNDGTLAGNRIVTQGANTLAFNGTATNAFSVDGTTLSVDAANNRIGIGTAAPGQSLGVVDGVDTNKFNGIASFFSNNLTSGVSIGWEGIQPVGSNTNIPLNLNAKGTGSIVMHTSGTTGNVGINSASPSSTLDVTAKNATGTATTVDGLLIPRVDRERAQSMSSVATSTLIYVNSIATGTATGTAANIDAIGYYFYNGTAWAKLGSDTNTNIYTNDGTLAGNRIVTQGANTLAFTGTATNAFSVDGTTLSVDAANNRIGIGTAAPGQSLGVVDGVDTNKFNGIASFFSNNLTSGVSIGWEGIQPVGSNTNIPLNLNAKGTGSIVMHTSGTTGNVGINSASPSSTLDVTAKNATGTATTPDGLLIPRVDRERAQSMTGVSTSTLIYVNSIATGTATGTAANIDAIGYYFYNGTAWAKLGSDTNTNIYTNDGTLAGNRIVTQGANTLAFTGTATNAFSVDGTTLSVDAANNRIGIGTAAPGQALGVVDAVDTNKFNGIASVFSNNLTSGVSIGWEGIQPVGLNTNIPLNLNAKGTGSIVMHTSGTTGNVGINSASPSSTLDVTAKNATGTATTVDGLLIPRVDRQRAQSMSSVATSTLIYVNSIATGTATGTAANIDAIGYYFYNGTAWAKLGSDTNTNIYTNDGTLAGNRIVTQGANTLAFTGTATNAFSVDGTTLSVDAANNRLGIGTAAPGQSLGVVDAVDTNKFNGIASFFSNNLTSGVSIGWEGIQPVGSNTNIPLNLNAKGTGSIVMHTSGTTGNVGINSASPSSTLDVTAKNATGTATTPDGLLIPRVDRQRAQSMSSVATSTLIYVNSIATGTATGTAANIDAIGYYFYNGTAWAKLGSDTNTNIYTNDGTLAGNRIVTQGANTLAFTGTATNAFSVDGTTLSVDAANNRIGIGTAAPGQSLGVVDAVDTNKFNGIASFLSNNLTSGISIGWEGIQPVGSNTNIPLNLNAKGTGDILMQTSGTTGRVGIGTTAPGTTLHIAGSIATTIATPTGSGCTNGPGTCAIPATTSHFAVSNGNWKPTLTMPASATEGQRMIVSNTAGANTSISTVNTSLGAALAITPNQAYEFVFVNGVWLRLL